MGTKMDVVGPWRLGDVLLALAWVGTPIVLGVWALIRARRPIAPDELERWSRRNDLSAAPTTDAALVRLATYLRRARLFAVIGGWLGFALGIAGAARRLEDVGGLLVPIVFGWLGGAAIAGAAVPHPAAGSARSADLVPRSVRSLVPGWLLLLVTVAPLASVALTVVHMAARGHIPSGVQYADNMSVSTYVAATVLCSGLTVGVCAALGWLVRRPRPSSAEDRAFDDGIIRHATRRVAAAGAALMLLVLSAQTRWLIDFRWVEGEPAWVARLAPLDEPVGLTLLALAAGLWLVVARWDRAPVS